MINQITMQLQKVIHQREALTQTKNQKLLNTFNHWDLFNLSELHVIYNIGLKESLNVTSIAFAMSMTRGAISKICSKLLKKGLIQKKLSTKNLKEIHYSLTTVGQKVYRVHEEQHSLAVKSIHNFLNKYSPSELEFIHRLLQDILLEFEKEVLK